MKLVSRSRIEGSITKIYTRPVQKIPRLFELRSTSQGILTKNLLVMGRDEGGSNTTPS